MKIIKIIHIRFRLLAAILLSVSINLLAQYEESEAYLVITGMKLNENPVSYVKDPFYGKDAVVKITKKDGITLEKQVTEFSTKRNGLTYYTADFKVPLDIEYSIEMKFSDGSVVSIPNYKLLSSWKTHFYFHSTDGSLSPSCILRSQAGLDKDLRLCVFAVYPYSNYLSLGGKQTFTDIKTPYENINNINIYPNPATDNAVLRFNLDMPMQVKISIKTLSGIVLNNDSGYYRQGENRINLMSEKQLPAGLYFVQLLADGKESVQKMLVY